MPPTRSFAEMQTEAEARSSAGGGGGGGGVPNWDVPMQAPVDLGTQIAGIIAEINEGCDAMMEEKDVKLKHQQYEIAHQKTTIEKLQALERKSLIGDNEKTTIEKLQANVKIMEAVM